MPKLPTDVSGRKAVKAFERAGWVVRRWGPHIVLTKEGMRPTLSVPDHRILASEEDSNEQPAGHDPLLAERQAVVPCHKGEAALPEPRPTHVEG